MLLRVRDLKTYFGDPLRPACAVDGISFEIDKGETFSLVGESGSGKSITALSILQLVPRPAGFHAGGSIEYKGQEITGLPESEKRRLRGREISMIFQEPMTSLNPVLTVGYQLMEPLRLHQNLTRKEARRKAITLLGEVNIPDPEQRVNEYPHQLSGGMKQRVMIAMAMACEPGLLIADEPTTALDVTIQNQILELMKALQKKKGTAILLITHDLGVVAENAHRVGIMYAGRIVEIGGRADILGNPTHPYTIKLLQSVPSRTKSDRMLQTIEGRVHPSNSYPKGCRFAERCQWAQETCRERDPVLLPIEPEHFSACVLYDEQLQGRRISSKELRTLPAPRLRQASRDFGLALVEIEGLKVHFPIRQGLLRRVVGHVKAVDGVDLSIKKGQTLALVGESGCGKSTLGKALLRLIRPTGGRVLMDGQDRALLNRKALHPYRRRMQVIFQDPFSALDPRMMIGESVTEGMAAHGIGKDENERSL